MAEKQRNQVCEDFYKAYQNLTDTMKNNFSRLCNKLLNDNFVYGNKQEDRNDYYEILNLKTMIENYFSMMDFELVHIDTYRVFYIQTTADRNRIRLKKLDTVILLLLRLLYYKGSLDINSNSDISTTIGKLTEEINKTGIYKSSIPITELMNSLRLLKRYKIIQFSFNDVKEDNVIVIYPTILFVVKNDNVDMLNNQIQAFVVAKGDEEDEVNQD